MSKLEHERKLRFQKYLDKASGAKTFKQFLQHKKMAMKNMPDKSYSKKDLVWVVNQIQEAYDNFRKKKK